MEMIRKCKYALRKFFAENMPAYPVLRYALQGRGYRYDPVWLGRQRFKRGFFYYRGARKF